MQMNNEILASLGILGQKNMMPFKFQKLRRKFLISLRLSHCRDAGGVGQEI
jgi:hypothetical protein